MLYGILVRTCTLYHDKDYVVHSDVELVRLIEVVTYLLTYVLTYFTYFLYFFLT
jgi:hypothetical protein